MSPVSWKHTNAKRTSAKKRLKQVLQDGQLCSLNAGTSILWFPQFCVKRAASIQQLARGCQDGYIAQYRSWLRYLWQTETARQHILVCPPRVSALQRHGNAPNHEKIDESYRQEKNYYKTLARVPSITIVMPRRNLWLLITALLSTLSYRVYLFA